MFGLTLGYPQTRVSMTYITGCHICQMFKKGKNFQRPYQKTMNINTPAMTRISMDIKQMPVNRGYSDILVLLCEVSNYMVALPLSSTRTQNICRATTRPPRPSSTAECLHLIARLRGEQASAASWEPRPPFEATEMD